MRKNFICFIFAILCPITVSAITCTVGDNKLCPGERSGCYFNECHDLTNITTYNTLISDTVSCTTVDFTNYTCTGSCVSGAAISGGKCVCATAGQYADGATCKTCPAPTGLVVRDTFTAAPAIVPSTTDNLTLSTCIANLDAYAALDSDANAYKTVDYNYSASPSYYTMTTNIVGCESNYYLNGTVCKQCEWGRKCSEDRDCTNGANIFANNGSGWKQANSCEIKKCKAGYYITGTGENTSCSICNTDTDNRYYCEDGIKRTPCPHNLPAGAGAKASKADCHVPANTTLIDAHGGGILNNAKISCGTNPVRQRL